MENGKNCAFPSQDSNKYYHGLTKREYFAAIAMQGLLASPNFKIDVQSSVSVSEQFAISATKYADALLAELDKTKSE